MYFHGARFSNYEAWLSDPTHIKPSAQVVWPIVGQEILNGDVGGGFQGVQITSGWFQLWRASGITSELQLYTTAIGGLVLAAACFFAGWFHYHKAAPKLEWFQNVESMLNHHLGGLLGLGSLGWAGHQIHVSLPVNKLLDAGVDPKEIPLPHDLLLNKSIMADLYPSFAKGLAPFFTLNWSEYSDFLTFKGGLNPVTGGLWLSDTAHHHVAIAVLFLVAGHQYRTNWSVGHSTKEILDGSLLKDKLSIIVTSKRNFGRKFCLKRRTSLKNAFLRVYHNQPYYTLAFAAVETSQAVCKENSLPICTNKKNFLTKAKPKAIFVACAATPSSGEGPGNNGFNFNHFFQPGLYAIVNKKSFIKKFYYGEAGNLADRLSTHYTQLKNSNHECKKLQEDWLLDGEESFEFRILEMGQNPWSDRIARLRRERELIQQCEGNLYNSQGLVEIQQISFEASENQPNSIPVLAYGVTKRSSSSKSTRC